jgi:hypothetical protein
VKTFPKIAAAIILVVTGLAAAFALARPAQAWDVNHLPATFHVTHEHTGAATCGDYYVIIYAPDGFGVGKTGATLPNLCADSPTFQQDLDAFVDAPCSSPGATCTAATTTAAATTAAPDTTTAATTTAPPVTTTTVDPPPVTVTTTTITETSPATTATATMTATTTTTDVTAELAKLQAEIDALSARVTVLETKTGPVAVGPAPSGYAPSGIAYQT